MDKNSNEPQALELLQAQSATLKEALKQVLYQNEMLLTWVQGAIVTVDREGIVLSANERAQAAHGCTCEEDLIGKHYHINCHHTLDGGGEYPWEFCPVFAAIEDGSSHHITNDVFWKLDGTSFLVDCIVCPIRNEENEISGATITFRNLTEMKLKESKRVHGLKLESIGELSAGIAHEINTPIQFIGNNLSFLKEITEDLFSIIEKYEAIDKKLITDSTTQKKFKEAVAYSNEVDLEYLKEEGPKAIDQTLDGIERVSELVQGLKRFAHSGDNVSKENINLVEIIQNGLIVCKNSYKYVAEMDLQLDPVDNFKGYPGDLGQVFINLIVNAAQAITDVKNNTGEMGRISIKTSQDDQDIFVKISDTGAGIPESIKERIFDPFFTTKEVGEGSGQGLAISRTIINDKHNGELTIDSTSEAGTSFLITIPKAE